MFPKGTLRIFVYHLTANDSESSRIHSPPKGYAVASDLGGDGGSFYRNITFRVDILLLIIMFIKHVLISN